MYAIVKTGGKQYKVAEGDLVKVEKIEGEPGKSVALTPVLVVEQEKRPSREATAISPTSPTHARALREE